MPSPRPAAPDVLPFPRSVERNIAGFPPVPEIAPFDLVQVRVPFLLPASDLDREDIRQRLVGELAREPAFRLEANVQVQEQWRRLDDAENGVMEGGFFPGLMLGLSGFGMHFLRLARPDRVPSVLLLDPAPADKETPNVR